MSETKIYDAENFEETVSQAQRRSIHKNAQGIPGSDRTVRQMGITNLNNEFLEFSF